MRIYTLHCEMLTECSIQETFEVFKDPYNLAKITPPWLHFKVLSEGLIMRAGAEIEYVIRWLGIPMRWKSLISEYEPPFLFVDEQLKGPYRQWRHRHTFEATASGTKVSDNVEYVLPFGALGEFANSLLMRKQLQDIFEYRQLELKKMFGGQAVQIQQPVVTG